MMCSAPTAPVSEVGEDRLDYTVLARIRLYDDIS